MRRIRGEFVDETKVAHHRAELGAILDVYESRLLATSKYLAGDVRRFFSYNGGFKDTCY